MDTKPVNWDLVRRAEVCASGLAVHELANILHVYYLWCHGELYAPAAESELRAFIVRNTGAFLIRNSWPER